MCVQCAIVAAAGASGARSWLQNAGLTWLTPKRLKRFTIGLCIAAAVVSTIGVSGSTAPTRHDAPAVVVQH